MRFCTALFVTTVLLPGVPLAAQDPTPSPYTFHSGQWGAQFSVGNGFYGVGALRFSTPNAAWAFGGNFYATHRTQGPGDYSSNFLSTGLSVGRRWHRPGADRIRPFSELGISGGYSWGEDNYSGVVYRTQGYGGGAYGRIGAMVFFAPELSIGASWGANLSYNHDHTENTGPGFAYSSDRSYLTFDAGRIQLVGALYF